MRRRLGTWFALLLAVALSTILATPAWASFHLARIVEIHTGSAQYPNAQYVVILPYANLQNQFATVRVTVYDSGGSQLTDFATFAVNLPSTTTNQVPILVANAAAVGLFGIQPEQVASGTLPASGMICFQRGITVPDCVSYGNYTGSSTAGGSSVVNPEPAPPNGMSMQRDLGGDGVLQFSDDTNDADADFFSDPPSPSNFEGIVISDLTVQKSGAAIELSWTGNPISVATTIHKTGDPTTVRNSAMVDTVVNDNTWGDPNPAQFAGLTCYLVKP
jgi:hypothetical protein